MLRLIKKLKAERKRKQWFNSKLRELENREFFSELERMPLGTRSQSYNNEQS